MIVKVFGVFQVILIQIISAQPSNQDLLWQNGLNYLANTPLAGYGRSRRHMDNPPVGEPGSGDLSLNGFAHGLPFRNGMPSGNSPSASGLTNNYALHNGLANNLAFNNGLQNSFGLNSPFNLPFSNMNIAPKNRMVPNVDGININRLSFNVPNGLPSLNNVPNGLPSFNNMPNGLPSLNNLPIGLPSLNNAPNGLPSLNNLPNELPGFNNVPNGLPSFNNAPNGLPSFNNMLNGLPSMNNVPNGLPSLNNMPNGLPSLNNVPNGLPSLNNMPNALPGFNNVPNGFLNINNVPFRNNFLNLNNVPVGQNILNLNNVPAANLLPNIINMPIPNVLPSFNNLPCNTFPQVPTNNELPLNLPSGNPLPPIKNQLPYLNNFRITGIGIGNGIADINRFPRNGLPDGNMLPNAYNLQNGNGLAQQVADELSNVNDYQTNNEFSGFTNTPSVSTHNVLVDNTFSSINNFPKDGLRNYAVEAQNIKNMQLNFPDVSNVQNYNGMPINEQRFVNSVPFHNGFADANNFPADTGLPNANGRLVNAINNGLPLSNGGYSNDILYTNNDVAVNMPETYLQNSDGNGFTSNDFQLGNVQVPNHWNYDFVGAKMPANQNVLPEGVQMFSNVPNDHQSVLMPNNLNLAQELIKNLKIEGNMPFLNGLPVADITETVTVLNGDQHSEFL